MIFLALEAGAKAKSKAPAAFVDDGNQSSMYVEMTLDILHLF